MIGAPPAYPATSSRRRPGPATSFRVGDVFSVKESCAALDRTSPPDLLEPVVGPGLRRDDGLGKSLARARNRASALSPAGMTTMETQKPIGIKFGRISRVMIGAAAYPVTSSRRRPGPATSFRVGDVFSVKESCAALDRTSPPDLLEPVVGPGLRRDDGFSRLKDGAIRAKQINVRWVRPLGT